MGGAVFGGRRAIVLKSHGFDLLQERKSKETLVRQQTRAFFPWDLVHAVSLHSPLPEASFTCYSGNTCVYERQLRITHSVRCCESNSEQMDNYN